MLDDLGTSAQAIHNSLDFMCFVNAFFGGARVVSDYFNKNKTPAKFTVLDVGSGGGDIPFALTQLPSGLLKMEKKYMSQRLI